MSALTWQYKPKNKTHRQDHVLSKPKPSAMRFDAIQAKLTVGQPDDIYEQEADRLADRVMRMTDESLVQRQTGCPGCEEEEELIQTKPLAEGITPLVQRQSLDDEEEMLQRSRKPGRTPEVTPGIESNINSLKSGGQPLSPGTRCFFEPRFGVDFSHVRVYHDSSAAQSAQAINAKAYTIGNNIAFNQGQYSPGTTGGKRLLAHELTHVVQNGGKGSNTIQREVSIDIRNHTILPSFAEDLTDAELQEQKTILSTHISGLSQGSPEYEAAILNLEVLLNEERERTPSDTWRYVPPKDVTRSIVEIQAIVGTNPDGEYGRKTWEAVKKYQTHLNIEGLYSGDIDGKWGTATDDAHVAFAISLTNFRIGYNCAGFSFKTYEYHSLADTKGILEAMTKLEDCTNSCNPYYYKFWFWEFGLSVTDTSTDTTEERPDDFHIVGGQTNSKGKGPINIMSKNGQQPVVGPRPPSAWRPETGECRYDYEQDKFVPGIRCNISDIKESCYCSQNLP